MPTLPSLHGWAADQSDDADIVVRRRPARVAEQRDRIVVDCKLQQRRQFGSGRWSNDEGTNAAAVRRWYNHILLYGVPMRVVFGDQIRTGGSERAVDLALIVITD